jgi:hypothetical protein
MSDALISIIESVIAARATAKARSTAPAPAYLVRRFTKAQPPAAQPAAPPPPKPAPAVAPPRPVVAEAPPAPRIALQRLIDGPDSLIRLVLSAEILGPPIALRQQNPWDTPGV